MEKNRKKIRVVWLGTVIVLALLLGICRGAFSLSDSTFYTLYWLLMLSILVSYYAINQLWYREFVAKVNSLMPILTEQKDADRFIAESEKLLEGKKSAQIKAILRINLCLGYCEKGNYQEAQRQLETINSQKLHGISRTVYLADAAYVAFYLGETDKAVAFMEQNRKALDKLEDSQAYGGLIAILHVFELLGEPERARELYTAARKRWEDSRNSSDFDYLQRLLYDSETVSDN